MSYTLNKRRKSYQCNFYWVCCTWEAFPALWKIWQQLKKCSENYEPIWLLVSCEKKKYDIYVMCIQEAKTNSGNRERQTETYIVTYTTDLFPRMFFWCWEQACFMLLHQTSPQDKNPTDLIIILEPQNWQSAFPHFVNRLTLELCNCQRVGRGTKNWAPVLSLQGFGL